MHGLAKKMTSSDRTVVYSLVTYKSLDDSIVDKKLKVNTQQKFVRAHAVKVRIIANFV